MPEEFFQIKKSYVLYAGIGIVCFLFGFLGTNLTSLSIKRQKAPSEAELPSDLEQNCRTFCQLARGQFDHLESDHCFCTQQQMIPDQANNRTIIVTQVVDVGVVKSIEARRGVP